MKKGGCLFILLLLLSGNLQAESADSLLHRATALYDQNNYAPALQHYLKALEQAEEDQRTDRMVMASLYIARCHYYLYDRKAALKWYYTALNTIEHYRVDSLRANVYYNLGVIYIEAEQVDSAEKYAYAAIQLFRTQKEYARLAQTYCTLTELYLNTTKNPQQIESTVAQAEKYAELSQNKGMMAFAASKRYNYHFFLKKDYREALRYINKAEQLYLETGNREAILNAFRAKAECLAMLGDTTAVAYMGKWFRFKDSILQADKAASVAQYETLYETEKKERENKLLQQQNKLNRLSLLIVVAVFLLLAAIGLWWINRNRLHQKQEELQNLQNLQKERERIARDLHDNVGGQLSYIIHSLDGINEEQADKRTALTESITHSVRSVIGNLRETIWAINDAGISVQDFSDKLKVFARNLFKHTDTKIHFTEQIANNHELNALLSLNLYRICQEILNNAYKHAQASEVQVVVKNEVASATLSEHKLTITISDNGIGFSETPENKERYGLPNIRSRAEEFGITVTLKTEKGKGTTYTLIV